MKTVTIITGEAMSGKTDKCLEIAAECVSKGLKVLFITKEDYPEILFKRLVGKVYGDETITEERVSNIREWVDIKLDAEFEVDGQVDYAIFDGFQVDFSTGFAEDLQNAAIENDVNVVVTNTIKRGK